MLEAIVLLSVSAVQAAGSRGATAQVTAPRLELARRIGADPSILGAVIARNQAPESAEAIQRNDQEWQRNREMPLRKELTHNPCAMELKKLVASDPAVVEAFVMDAQGGLVCSTVETSDYWQGDEAKWTRTDGEGKERVVDTRALDTSTGKYAIQLSTLSADKGRKVGALPHTLKIPRAQMNP